MQHHHSIGYALNHLDVAEIGKAALIGAVAGVGGPETLAGGLAGRMAVGGVTGAAAQVGDNLLHGRHWSSGVAESAAIGAASVGLFAGGAAGVRALLRTEGRAALADAGELVGSSCGLSFSADTPVATPTGSKPIASIKVGDQVIAYDPRTGKVSPQTVVQVFANRDTDLVDVTVRTEAALQPHSQERSVPSAGGVGSKAGVETIHTTANHPWLTPDRGWIEAGALRPDEPVQLETGGVGRIVSVTADARTAFMFDLSLADVHTFAVGVGAYIVHNCPANPFQGGRFGALKTGAGIERHHMIADSVSTFARKDGPSIQMEVSDHRMTASWGNSAAARAYRAEQRAMVAEGDTAGALQTDILNVRGMFGPKYDDAIRQMLHGVFGGG